MRLSRSCQKNPHLVACRVDAAFLLLGAVLSTTPRVDATGESCLALSEADSVLQRSEAKFLWSQAGTTHSDETHRSSEALASPAKQLDLSHIDWGGRWNEALALILEQIPGPYAVFVGDADGLVGSAGTTDYDYDRPIEIASASMWHTGITAMALVDDGVIEFNAPVSKYLDFWTTDSADPRSKVRVHHLFQFTSGFGSEHSRFHHSCIGRPSHTFKSCAEIIYKSTYGSFKPGSRAQPGEFFFYDHTHIEILGAVAEAASGKTWAQLYKEKVADKIRMTIGADNLNGWGYSHPNLGKVLHISANDNMKFMTALFKTMHGHGTLLKKPETVERFRAVGVNLCRSMTGQSVNGGSPCNGWLSDKIGYASTHFTGIDASKRIYRASPGIYGFWPEMILPEPGALLPNKAPNGFWWQLAIQLPGRTTTFISGNYGKVVEAIRGFFFMFFDHYERSWGVVMQAKYPSHACAWPAFCACAQSDTEPNHPLDQRRCDAGLKASCKSGQLHNEVCFAPKNTTFFDAPKLKRKRLQRSIEGSCSLDACELGSNHKVFTGCPSFSNTNVGEQCDSRTSKAAVRCCDDTGKPVSMSLGPPDYSCHGRSTSAQAAVTFAEATLKCSSWGLRLCRVAELDTHCRNGCGFGPEAVWVSDLC